MVNGLSGCQPNLRYPQLWLITQGTYLASQPVHNEPAGGATPKACTKYIWVYPIYLYRRRSHMQPQLLIFICRGLDSTLKPFHCENGGRSGPTNKPNMYSCAQKVMRRTSGFCDVGSAGDFPNSVCASRHFLCVTVHQDFPVVRHPAIYGTSSLGALSISYKCLASQPVSGEQCAHARNQLETLSVQSRLNMINPGVLHMSQQR